MMTDDVLVQRLNRIAHTSGCYVLLTESCLLSCRLMFFFFEPWWPRIILTCSYARTRQAWIIVWPLPRGRRRMVLVRCFTPLCRWQNIIASRGSSFRILALRIRMWRRSDQLFGDKSRLSSCLRFQGFWYNVIRSLLLLNLSTLLQPQVTYVWHWIAMCLYCSLVRWR